MQKACGQDPQLVMIAVGNNQGDRYSSIKKVCCITSPVASQVVTGRVMDTRNRSKMLSVATKVAIQINCKIGNFVFSFSNQILNCRDFLNLFLRWFSMDG